MLTLCYSQASHYLLTYRSEKENSLTYKGRELINEAIQNENKKIESEEAEIENIMAERSSSYFFKQWKILFCALSLGAIITTIATSILFAWVAATVLSLSLIAWVCLEMSALIMACAATTLIGFSVACLCCGVSFVGTYKPDLTPFVKEFDNQTVGPDCRSASKDKCQEKEGIGQGIGQCHEVVSREGLFSVGAGVFFLNFVSSRSGGSTDHRNPSTTTSLMT